MKRALTIQVVTTARLIKGILDLLGRGWLILNVTEERPGWFLVKTRRAG